MAPAKKTMLTSCHATFTNRLAECQPRGGGYANDFCGDRGLRQADTDVGGSGRDVLTGLRKRSLSVSSDVVRILDFHILIHLVRISVAFDTQDPSRGLQRRRLGSILGSPHSSFDVAVLLRRPK